jgi:hypothetical protein
VYYHQRPYEIGDALLAEREEIQMLLRLLVKNEAMLPYA